MEWKGISKTVFGIVLGFKRLPYERNSEKGAYERNNETI